MNVIPYSGPVEMIAVGIEPGEMLLETIDAAIRQHDVQNGAVVSGIGTLKTCRMHYITHTRFPSNDEFYTLEEPLELLSVSGIIADGKPHLHISVSCGQDQVWGGHLEPESEVLYLAEILILKANDMRMRRRKHPELKVSLLGPAD